MALDGPRDFDPNVPTTNVTPEIPTGGIPLAVAEIGSRAAEAQEQSKMLMYGAQAHAQYKALDAQFRQQYADDPTNKQGLEDLQAKRQDIADSFGQNISVFYQRQWQTKMTQIGAQSDVSNEAWSVHQSYHNAVNNTNVGIKQYLDTGNQDGKAYGASGATDGGNIMNFLSARKNITDHVSQFIGMDKTSALLKSFDSDYVKSFVSGVAETNPQEALKLINSPEINQHFTTDEKDDMVQVVEKVQKTQKLAQSLTMTMTDSNLPDIVNNPNTSYYEKRASIDQLDMNGSITPQAASKARRVIKSSDDLNRQTDTPTMSAIINQAYDLNSNAATNPDDYLRGVRNIQNKILDSQASGQLTAPDAMRLQNTVRNLTSAKLSSATQSVGNEFYDANQKFNALPPEFRGEATRQLFYATDGKNMNPKQIESTAMGVIDNINASRRSAALKAIKATSQNDDELLRGLNATQADVEATAKKHGISTDEVIRQLRQSRLNKIRQDRGEESIPASAPQQQAAPEEPRGVDDSEGGEGD